MKYFSINLGKTCNRFSNLVCFPYREVLFEELPLELAQVEMIIVSKEFNQYLALTLRENGNNLSLRSQGIHLDVCTGPRLLVHKKMEAFG